jgi:hypothetical protein
MKFRCLLLFVFIVPGLKAQTISPISTEISVKPGKTARGSFQFQNNLLTTSAATVEIFNFSIENGKPKTRPLDPTTHVELGQSPSVKLGAKEIYQWDYKIRCDTPSCNVVFKVSEFTGKTPEGLAVKIILPTVVYVGNSKHPRKDALDAAGVVLAARK